MSKKNSDKIKNLKPFKKGQTGNPNGRPRDLDGMAATILDCLTKSGRIQDDKRQIVSRLFVDYELCKKGQEGFRVRIIT